MGSFSLSGAFTACLDPDYQSYGLPLRGGFIGGKPVYQGWESGTLKFPPLISAGFNELYARWAANIGAQVSGALPKLSGYGWRAVSAWWGQPLPTGWDGGLAHGVTMNVWRIGNY